MRSLVVLCLSACARRVPVTVERPRAGWLQDIAETVSLRPATACERLAAQGDGETPRDAEEGIARTVELDLDGDGRDERLVVAIRRETVVAITGDDCAVRWRGTPGSVVMQGPTLAENPWEAIPEAEIERLGATDRLPMGASNSLWVVRGNGRHRHALFLRVGSLARLRYGWSALVLSCHAGTCRGDSLGHQEWAAVPRTHGCGPTARTNRPPPYVEDPMLRVEPGALEGELALTPHARLRDTCDPRAEEVVRALETVRIPTRH